MAEHDAKVSGPPSGGEDPDDAFFPDLLVLWDEVTRDEVAAFETALKAARDERDMQRFLEAHPRLLIQHLTAGRRAWVIPKKRLGSEYETDFMIAQKASDGFVWLAVELERPQAKLFNQNGDPSAALNHALRQISDWRIWLSRNRDYAIRPREQSGLNLTDVEANLEGLIIMGRDADVDQRTNALRREWQRAHRIEIETYDWLLAQASERVAALERAGKRHPAAQFFDTLVSNPRTEEPARKAVREVFGGIYDVSVVSTVRDLDWDEIIIGSDPDPDENVRVPLKIIYKNPWLLDRLIVLDTHDWDDWLHYVESDIAAEYGLLVIEDTPAKSLQERLTLERDGIWYVSEWFTLRRYEEPKLAGLHVLVHLPPEISYNEKRSRVAVAREVLQRYIPDPARERERELEREREAELKIISLSLNPGDRVEHDEFGFGTVVSMSSSGAKTEAMIDFGEEHGVRHLVLCHAPLKKL
jgi:Domain of unknown function (DUF4263)